MQELYPRTDEALHAARLYLTEKERAEAHVAAFEAALAKLTVPVQERARLVARWKERMHNSGRMTAVQAESEAVGVAQYAAGHAERSKAFVLDWLDSKQATGDECAARVSDLRRAVMRTLGG